MDNQCSNENNFDYLCTMKKRFNVTGVCIPGQHYVADTSAKFVYTLLGLPRNFNISICKFKTYEITPIFRLPFLYG
jgi:hypothetical protein